MITTKLRFLMALSLMAILACESSAKSSEQSLNSYIISIEKHQDNDDFKYGQYVVVVLKDGSQTFGKIAGKKSSKKYFVNQIDGSNRGLVHKKYIRKMTKEEIEVYKSARKKI